MRTLPSISALQSKMAVLPMDTIRDNFVAAIDALEAVTVKSKSIKGDLIREMRISTRIARAAMDLLQNPGNDVRASGLESRAVELTGIVEDLREENRSLQGTVDLLRREVEDLRGRVNRLSPETRSPSSPFRPFVGEAMEGVEGGRGKKRTRVYVRDSSPDDPDDLVGEFRREEARARAVRLEEAEARLAERDLPVRSPPKKRERRKALPMTTRSGGALSRGIGGVSTSRVEAAADAALAPAGGRAAGGGGRKTSSAHPVALPGSLGVPGSGSSARAEETPWSRVLGRKAVRRLKASQQVTPSLLRENTGGTSVGGRAAAARPVTAGRPTGSSGRSGRRARRRARGPRPPSMSAVMLTVPEGGISYRDALAEVRGKISLTGLGIEYTRLRMAQCGGVLLEISGAGREEKASSLAASMREVLGDRGVTVTRPMRSSELRLRGLDLSVTPADVAEALAQLGGCSAVDVRVGAIRVSPVGVGACWARCPAGAAHRAASKGKIKVGWSLASVEALAGRPMQCFRCLAFGHVRRRCTAEIDRSEQCYRCGDRSHVAARCTAAPRCAACADIGRAADHRSGTKACAAASGVRRRRRAPGAAGADVPAAAGGGAAPVGVPPSGASPPVVVPPSGSPTPSGKTGRGAARSGASPPVVVPPAGTSPPGAPAPEAVGPVAKAEDGGGEARVSPRPDSAMEVDEGHPLDPSVERLLRLHRRRRYMSAASADDSESPIGEDYRIEGGKPGDFLYSSSGRTILLKERLEVAKGDPAQRALLGERLEQSEGALRSIRRLLQDASASAVGKGPDRTRPKKTRPAEAPKGEHGERQ